MNEYRQIDQAPVDQHIHDLLNRSIDGEMSGSDQDELDRLLVTSESVRTLNQELRSVAHILDELPEIEPPPYLQESIERQVRLPVQVNDVVGKPGLLSSWLNANWLRTGFALAAGVVLTVGVYEMGSKPITADDVANMSGTVVKGGFVDQQGILLDSISLDTDQLRGRVELRSMDDLFTLDMQLSSDGPSEVIVNFAGRGLEFDGVIRNQDQLNDISFNDGSIKLASNGEQRYTLRLKRTTEVQQLAPLELDFFANNVLIQKAELTVSQ